MVGPINKPAQIQVGHYQPQQWRGRKTQGQQKCRTTTQVVTVALVLHWHFAHAFFFPPGRKKKNQHLGLSLEKGEEMGLKLQRKERSADWEQFFPLLKKKNTHKEESIQFKSFITAWTPQASFQPTGKGHSSNWSLWQQSTSTIWSNFH